MVEGTEALLPGPPPCVVRHRYAKINGVRLHYAEADPQPDVSATARADTVNGQAKLCVALHGFPEFWYSWHRQIPALAAAGFRVVALDQRGYNTSDKPPGVGSYRLHWLAADVAGLVAHAGYEKAHIIGHDWGGAVAWAVAMRHPRVVDRLAILNAPHPAIFLRELQTREQRLRSWYMLFFQLPALPEMVVRSGNYSFLDRVLLKETVHCGAFSAEDVRLYRQALARPGALTAALNYYRAMCRHRREDRALIRRVTVPTLVLWGERDRYLGPRLTEGMEPWVPDLCVERIADASHWVQNDVPERVNRALRAFL